MIGHVVYGETAFICDDRIVGRAKMWQERTRVPRRRHGGGGDMASQNGVIRNKRFERERVADVLVEEINLEIGHVTNGLLRVAEQAA